MMVVSTNVCGRILIQINILGLNLYQHYLAESKVYHCGNYLSNNTTKYKRQWRFFENVVPSRGTLLL